MLKMREKLKSGFKKIGVRLGKDIREYWPVVLPLAAYLIITEVIFGSICPMVIMTGLPCPGCGLTRAALYFLSGRIRESLYINPMGIPVVCLLAYFFFNRYVSGKRAKGLMPLIAAASAALLVLYCVRMYKYFPDREPYVYTERNILAGMWGGYEEILRSLSARIK